MANPTLSPADQKAAAELAQKMARAAGKVRPSIMAHACMALMETAVMVGDANAYVEWTNKMRKDDRNEQAGR